jgi:cell division protein FtsW
MKRVLFKKPPDFIFIAIAILLTLFGLVMLSSASSDLGKNKFGDGYYYLKHQIYYGLSLGILGFIIGFAFYYGFWEKTGIPLLIATIILLILVFSPLGVNIKGGARWLNIGSLTFQPGEILKLTFFIYLAAWVARNQSRSRKFLEGFLPFLTLVGGIMLLLLLQPATTTSILIFGASILMYFTAGARMSFLIIAVFIAAVAVSLLVYFSPYRFERVLAFLNPERDPLGSSYHINQAQIAIGAGGLFGVGFGQSTTKLKFLPEPIGDSIFAIIAEELGFVGASLVVLVFLVFVWRGFYIAKRAPDTFSRVLVSGFVSLIGLQAFVNMSAISGLIPLSGVPLPFISYGGTALAVFLTMVGIIANISRYSR